MDLMGFFIWLLFGPFFIVFLLFFGGSAVVYLLLGIENLYVGIGENDRRKEVSGYLSILLALAMFALCLWLLHYSGQAPFWKALILEFLR